MILRYYEKRKNYKDKIEEYNDMVNIKRIEKSSLSSAYEILDGASSISLLLNEELKLKVIYNLVKLTNIKILDLCNLKNKELIKLCDIERNKLKDKIELLELDIFNLNIELNNLKGQLKVLETLISECVDKMSYEDKENMVKCYEIYRNQDKYIKENSSINFYDAVDLKDVPKVKIKRGI